MTTYIPDVTAYLTMHMHIHMQGGEAVDKRAQRTAFPPNYIHSLDAAHMMMTAIQCYEQGVSFGGE